jgi:hypothetical protein
MDLEILAQSANESKRMRSPDFAYASIMVYLLLTLLDVGPENLVRLYSYSGSWPTPVVCFPGAGDLEGNERIDLHLQKGVSGQAALRPVRRLSGKIPNEGQHETLLSIPITDQRGITDPLWCRSSTNWIS